jgi:hypothetical protein
MNEPKRGLPDDQHKKCPFCAEPVLAEAVKCRYCGEWLEVHEAGEGQTQAAEADPLERWREWIEPAPPGCSWRRYIVGAVKRVVFMGFLHDVFWGGRK